MSSHLRLSLDRDVEARGKRQKMLGRKMLLLSVYHWVAHEGSGIEIVVASARRKRKDLSR